MRVATEQAVATITVLHLDGSTTSTDVIEVRLHWTRSPRPRQWTHPRQG